MNAAAKYTQRPFNLTYNYDNSLRGLWVSCGGDDCLKSHVQERVISYKNSNYSELIAAKTKKIDKIANKIVLVVIFSLVLQNKIKDYAN